MWWGCIVAIAVWPRPMAADVLAGRILEDHSGAPVPRAEIRISQANVPGILAELESDPQGRFRAPGLPEGEYRLQIAKPYYAGATVRLRARPDDSPADSLVLRLVRYGAISGRVLDEQGRPEPSAQIVAVAESVVQNVGHDSRGEYRIYGLAPGRYRVAVLTTGEGRDLRRGVLFHPNNSQPRSSLFRGARSTPAPTLSLARRPHTASPAK